MRWKPFAIAVTPDGKTAYVADLNAAAVTPIDIATDTAGPDIAVGSRPNLKWARWKSGWNRRNLRWRGRNP